MTETISVPVTIGQGDDAGSIVAAAVARIGWQREQQRRRTELESFMVPPALRYFPLYPHCPFRARSGPTFVIPKRGIHHGA